MAEEALISVVDDDLSLLSSLVRLICSLGYTARGFGSAEEFLKSGLMADCACVITDIQMPGMSGIELAGVISAQRPQLSVITITARAEPALRESALANGAVFFLRKPIDTKVLAECLEQALGRKETWMPP